MQESTTVKPIDLGRPATQILDSSGNAINLQSGEIGDIDPFDKTVLSSVKGFFAKYGVDLALILLICGSMAGTIFNSIRVGDISIVQDGLFFLSTLLICFGLVVEFGLAWSWSRRGTTRLVGIMRKRNDSIFRWSVWCILIDIMLAVSGAIVDIGESGIYWMIFGQPVCAIRIVFLWYKLKGEHPQTIAKQVQATVRAQNQANLALEESHKLKLVLDEKKFERQRERLNMETRHAEALKVLSSQRYVRTISALMKQKVREDLVPEVSAWTGLFKRSPKLLEAPTEKEGSTKK